VLPGVATSLSTSKLAILVVCLFFGFMILTTLTVYKCGARSQNLRYKQRQKDFNKIFRAFNRKWFNMRGVSWQAGEFGAYIMITIQSRFGDGSLS
jgi:hypothetical protein